MVATRAYISVGSVVGFTHSVIMVEIMRPCGCEVEVGVEVMKTRNSPKRVKEGS